MIKAQRNAPILTVSVAAELAGMHPQTVRQYDRLGLVVASRTRGGGRRYSMADVDRLIEIQRMSQEEGINLAGIARILALQDEVEALRARNARLEKQMNRLRELGSRMKDELDHQASLESRVFAASSDGSVTMAQGMELLRRVLSAQRSVVDEALTDRQDMVIWRPRTITVFE